jgi:hypothetical protein
MNSHTTNKFRKALSELPADIRKQARESYRLFVENPRHPSLHFKTVHSTRPIYSARDGIHYRAVGILAEDDIIWYWIGHHSEYDKLIRAFKK